MTNLGMLSLSVQATSCSVKHDLEPGVHRMNQPATISWTHFLVYTPVTWTLWTSCKAPTTRHCKTVNTVSLSLRKMDANSFSFPRHQNNCPHNYVHNVHLYAWMCACEYNNRLVFLSVHLISSMLQNGMHKRACKHQTHPHCIGTY